MNLLWLAAFSSMFAVDYIWVWYTRAVTQYRPTLAANLAATLFLVSAGNTLAYVDNPTLLLPGVAGAWAGTFVAGKGLS